MPSATVQMIDQIMEHVIAQEADMEATNKELKRENEKLKQELKALKEQFDRVNINQLKH
ncbi:uncharacterized protein F5147DRAFT_766982 [Suillus discolor]|uniref:XRCC4 coiled-coil domain-containing protein n=1 Tax=Suillus discolor TaxID=1912936 RepID=A0A9P7JZS1_9AGAM|nr:uncharacterized protein F5147DRAFT_766982 [Suillus discolor]KAG2119492.1 hypothetical protein F5147DRAFT_766982 [Suillus discolor]